MYAILLLLILVPAPKAEPIKQCPYVGAWSIDWIFPGGQTFYQTTFFNAGGTCYSPEYESGTWEVDKSGYVWFSERDGKNRYVMLPDWDSGTSPLWSVRDDGTIKLSATLRIRRGEYLHDIPPREVQ